MLDTLKYVNILESKGFTREQAEAQVGLVRDVMYEELATRQDLKDLRTELKSEMAEIRSDLKNLEFKLIIKMGTLMTIMTGIILAVLK
jgi:hypothetical protein